MKFPTKNLKKNLKMKILSVHYNKKSLQSSFVHLLYVSVSMVCPHKMKLMML
jgi:hypothetical protein